MLQFSLSEAPNTEKLRQRLTTPISAIISPAENTNIPTIDLTYEQIPRCRKCNGYISNFCKRDESSWTCALCGTKNNEKIEDFLPHSEDIEVKVDEHVGIPIVCLYLDLGFHDVDLKVMRSGIIAFLKAFKDTNFIIIFGVQVTELSILCPHISYYKKGDFGPICTYKEGNKVVDAPAPLVNFQSFPEDITPFIFHSSQVNSIISSIEKLSTCPRPHFSQLASCAYKLSEYLPYNPIHFIGITPETTYLDSAFKDIYMSLITIDILTPIFNQDSVSSAKQLPGRLLFFNADTFLSMLAFATRERPSFQLLMGSRISSGKAEWKLNPFPFQFENRGVFNAHSISLRRQPFVLDIHPNGGDEIVLQVTAKFITYKEKSQNYQAVLKIFNRKVKLSSDIPTILSSVDTNALLWLWITRTLSNPSHDVIAALFRVIANYIGSLPDDSPAIPLLTSTCCSLKYYGLSSEQPHLKLISQMTLCSLPPRMISMAPDVRGEQNAKVCTTISGVYADNPQDEKAAQEAIKLGFTASIVSPIPEWCLQTDQKSLDFLESLIPDK